MRPVSHSPLSTYRAVSGIAFSLRFSARLLCRLVLAGGLVLLPTAWCYAQSEQSLTLDLPPSAAAQAARAAKQRAAKAAAHTSVVPKRSRASAGVRRGSYASRHARRERVVGRLGQLQQATAIYRGRSTQTPRMTEAPAGTYVAIQEEEGNWIGVLMADGSTGWLRRESVRPLNYQVVSSGTLPAPAAPVGTDAGDIYPRSSAPYFTGDAQTLLAEAYKYMGVRYVWGGNTSNGIDCSGLVRNVFAACGFPLPRLGSDQMAYGVPVPFNQLQAGDRLYFGRRKERVGVTHTGIYIGNGYFIHASSSRHGVAVSRLDEPLYARIYVCARR